MQAEMSELRQVKTQLAEKIQKNREIINLKTPTVEEVQQFNRLKEEKVKILTTMFKLWFD